jgi:UDP-2,3-diacylglucosamine pyrophosphatase LpxH
MDQKPLRVKTVIISDVHLGTHDCKIREVNHFLKYTRCERLILNGDILDGWRLKQSGYWPKSHTRFVRLVLKKLEKKDTEVIYLRGNHDDVLAKFLPIAFENFSMAMCSTPSPKTLSSSRTSATGATASSCASTGSTTNGAPGRARNTTR